MQNKNTLIFRYHFLFTNQQTMTQNNEKRILVAYFLTTRTTVQAAEKTSERYRRRTLCNYARQI